MKFNFLNRKLRILYITNGFVLLAGAMLAPIYALFVEDMGGDLLDAGLTSTVFFLTAGIVTLLSGKYSDKIKENELIVVFGYVIMAIGFSLYLFASSIWMLYIIQFVIGLGEAIYSPPFDAIYSKYLDKGKSGDQWGIWEAMSYFSIAAGAFAGGLVVTYFGFNSIFVIMSLLCLMSAIYIYRLPRKVL